MSKVAALYLLALMLVFSGCGITRANVNSMDDLSNHESMIVARITLLYNGQPCTNRVSLFVHHEEESGDVSTWLYQSVHDNGLIVGKVPAGAGSLLKATCEEDWLTFHQFSFVPPYNIMFQLPEPGKAYYIGSVTVNWIDTPTGERASIAVPSAGGRIVVTGDKTKAIAQVRIDNEMKSVQADFQKVMHGALPLASKLASGGVDVHVGDGTHP